MENRLGNLKPGTRLISVPGSKMFAYNGPHPGKGAVKQSRTIVPGIVPGHR